MGLFGRLFGSDYGANWSPQPVHFEKPDTAILDKSFQLPLMGMKLKGIDDTKKKGTEMKDIKMPNIHVWDQHELNEYYGQAQLASKLKMEAIHENPGLSNAELRAQSDKWKQGEMIHVSLNNKVSAKELESFSKTKYSNDKIYQADIKDNAEVLSDDIVFWNMASKMRSEMMKQGKSDSEIATFMRKMSPFTNTQLAHTKYNTDREAETEALSHIGKDEKVQQYVGNLQYAHGDNTSAILQSLTTKETDNTNQTQVWNSGMKYSDIVMNDKSVNATISRYFQNRPDIGKNYQSVVEDIMLGKQNYFFFNPDSQKHQKININNKDDLLNFRNALKSGYIITNSEDIKDVPMLSKDFKNGLKNFGADMVTVQKKDANGNPILDKNGNPVYEQKESEMAKDRYMTLKDYSIMEGLGKVVPALSTKKGHEVTSHYVTYRNKVAEYGAKKEIDAKHNAMIDIVLANNLNVDKSKGFEININGETVVQGDMHNTTVMKDKAVKEQLESAVKSAEGSYVGEGKDKKYVKFDDISKALIEKIDISDNIDYGVDVQDAGKKNGKDMTKMRVVTISAKKEKDKTVTSVSDSKYKTMDSYELKKFQSGQLHDAVIIETKDGPKALTSGEYNALPKEQKVKPLILGNVKVNPDGSFDVVPYVPIIKSTVYTTQKIKDSDTEGIKNKEGNTTYRTVIHTPMPINLTSALLSGLEHQKTTGKMRTGNDAYKIPVRYFPKGRKEGGYTGMNDYDGKKFFKKKK